MIDWIALLQVALVTIVATCVIAALMSLVNWFFTIPEGQTAVTLPRKIGGSAMLVVIGLVLLFGLWLIIPYFH